jgi:hypothetical protein
MARAEYTYDLVTSNGPIYDARAYGSTLDEVTLAAAIAEIGSDERSLLITAGTWLLANSISIPANVELVFANGAILSIATAKTLAIAGGVKAEMDQQIFAGAGTVTLSRHKVRTCYPQWWGAKGDYVDDANPGTDDTVAIQAAIDSGVGVTLPDVWYRTTATITLSENLIYDFTDSVIYYGGSSIGVHLTSSGPIVRGLRVQRSVDFTDSAIGVQIDAMRRKTPEIFAYGFTTGIKLNLTGTSNTFGYNNCNFKAYGCKIGLHVYARTGGWANGCNFNKFLGGADGTGVAGSLVAGSMGVYIDASGESCNGLVFYSPLIEGIETAIYVDSEGRGHGVYGGYFEANITHIECTAVVPEFMDIGSTHINPTLGITLADATVTRFTSLLPQYNTHFLFYDEGLYRGKSQGFNNLISNGDFEYWIAANQAAGGWAASGEPEGIIKMSGSYSMKVDRSGGAGTSYVHFDIPEPYLTYLKGRTVRFSAWAYSTGVANAASVYLDDGVAAITYGTATTALATWTRITVMKTIDASATRIRCACRVLNNGIGYFDHAICQPGQNSTEFSPKFITEREVLPQIGAIPALADDATPTVGGGSLFLTGGTTTITDFDDGVEGQIITVIAEHGIDITDGTNIFLSGSATWTMSATDTLTLVCKADGKWYEVSRGDNGA